MSSSNPPRPARHAGTSHSYLVLVIEVVVILIGVIVGLVLADLALGGIRKRWRRRRDGASRR